MGVLVAIVCGVVGFFTWIFWGIIVSVVFFAAVGIPWGIWELFMFLTFNNIINLFAKLPSFIGAFFGFVLTLPFAIVSTIVVLWAYIQSIMMGLLTLRGVGNSIYCKNFINEIVVPIESSFRFPFVIVRYYYDHMQWLWGGAGFTNSWFFWQNGCGKGWLEGDFWWPCGAELPVPFQIIKLFLLGLPYIAMFILPLIPLLWCIFRPIVGACCALPAISGNGDGRD